MAFVTAHEGSRLELLVNFGILTGREATKAEIDRLARTIDPTPDRLAIVAERRHEYAQGDGDGRERRVGRDGGRAGRHSEAARAVRGMGR